MNRQTVGTVQILVAAVCFGLLAIFGKLAHGVGLNTMTLLTYRFTFATILLWAGLAIWGRVVVLTGRHLRVALSLGVLYAAFSGLFFFGLQYVPASIAGITFYIFPIIVYVLSVRFLHETITRRKLVALAMALAGVALVVAHNIGDLDAIGIGLIFLSACGYAIYITGSRAALTTISPDLLASTALIATAACFLLFGSMSGELFVPVGTDQWAIIVGIAIIGTAIPLFLYVNGLERLDASNVAVISTVEPIVTVIFGVALLGETLTLAIVGGGILVIVSVLLVQTEVAARVRTAH